MQPALMTSLIPISPLPFSASNLCREISSKERILCYNFTFYATAECAKQYGEKWIQLKEKENVAAAEMETMTREEILFLSAKIMHAILLAANK